MKKTVIKTAIITFLTLFILSVIAAVFVGAFAPARMGAICSDLGMKNVSALMYERQYEKSGDVKDLVKLVDVSVAAGSDEKVAYYSYVLVAEKNEQFREVCKNADDYRYYSFIAVEANYDVSEYEKSVEIAEKYGFEKNIYNERSPFYLAVRLALFNENKDYSSLLISAYERGEFVSSSELEEDIDKLKNL